MLIVILVVLLSYELFCRLLWCYFWCPDRVDGDDGVVVGVLHVLMVMMGLLFISDAA